MKEMQKFLNIDLVEMKKKKEKRKKKKEKRKKKKEKRKRNIIYDTMKSYIMNMNHYGDIFAIPFFLLLTLYFYDIEKKNPTEYVLLGV